MGVWIIAVKSQITRSKGPTVGQIWYCNNCVNFMIQCENAYCHILWLMGYLLSILKYTHVSVLVRLENSPEVKSEIVCVSNSILGTWWLQSGFRYENWMANYVTWSRHYLDDVIEYVTTIVWILPTIFIFRRGLLQEYALSPIYYKMIKYQCVYKIPRWKIFKFMDQRFKLWGHQMIKMAVTPLILFWSIEMKQKLECMEYKWLCYNGDQVSISFLILKYGQDCIWQLYRIFFIKSTTSQWRRHSHSMNDSLYIHVFQRSNLEVCDKANDFSMNRNITIPFIVHTCLGKLSKLMFKSSIIGQAHRFNKWLWF